MTMTLVTRFQGGKEGKKKLAAMVAHQLEHSLSMRICVMYPLGRDPIESVSVLSFSGLCSYNQ